MSAFTAAAPRAASPSPACPRPGLRALVSSLATVLALGMALTVTTVSPASEAAPAATKSAKKTKKTKQGKATAQTLSALLQDQGSAVQDCAGKSALDKGANRVAIVIRVTINNRGQLVDLRTTVTTDKAEFGPPVKECVESLIRAIKFPASDAPLITIDRNWTVSSG